MTIFKSDWLKAALGIAACLLIVPLWCVHSPGMPDYPAHIAGLNMLIHGVRSAPLANFYVIHWMFVPNLASELIVPVFAKLVPLETATKFFLSIGVAMWVLGPGAIQYALFKRIGPAPLAGAFFAYNAPYTWGFFNFYFAAGFGFLVFAAWIATTQKCKFVALFGFAAAFLALYAFHLFALLLVLLMIGGFELARVWEDRAISAKALLWRVLPIVLVCLPAALCFLFLRPAGNDDSHLAFNIMDTLEDRLGAAIQYYFDGPAISLTSALAVFWLSALFFGKLRLHPAMTITLIVLAVATLFAPEWALGGWGVHLRLPAVLGAIAFASVEFRIGPRRTAIMAGVLLLGLGWNATNLAEDWRGYDRQYSEFRQSLRRIPLGSKLVTILDSDALNDASDQPYWHMAEFAIVDRGAFTPLMFATKGQHIVQIRPPFDKLAAASAQQGSPPDVSELSDLATGRTDTDPDIEDIYPYLKFFQCHFDIAVIIHGDGDPNPVPKFLTLRHAGSFYSLYDIHPTGTCAKP